MAINKTKESSINFFALGITFRFASKAMKANYFASDYWKNHEEFIPDDKHLQTKAETYTVEGYNSRIRHYLAKFKRKGKCYSKADNMIEIFLNLLMLKLNNQLYTNLTMPNIYEQKTKRRYF